MPVDQYEAVIGLEVHTELNTVTKLFCGCPNEFGSEPNTNVCPVCLGLPGSLPVLNATVVEYALRLADALEFEVPERSIFARKNYFYPDMPKDYQISQYEDPILSDGALDVDHHVFLDLPAHRLLESAIKPLAGIDVHHAVGLARTMEEPRSTPREVAAATRLDRPRLHGKDLLGIVG